MLAGRRERLGCGDAHAEPNRVLGERVGGRGGDLDPEAEAAAGLGPRPARQLAMQSGGEHVIAEPKLLDPPPGVLAQGADCRRCSASTWLTAEEPRSWVALIHANRMASGSGARMKPSRRPPQSTSLREPTTVTEASGRAAAIGGGAASHAESARARSSTRGTRLCISNSAISLRRREPRILPVGLCSVDWR